MKTKTISGVAGCWVTLLIAAFGLTGTLPAQLRDSSRVLIEGQAAEVAGEAKEVTFLGISTYRVDGARAAKMKLPRESGLVVARVLGDSPSAGILRPRDLLMQLGDQMLLDPRQLGVLVRSHQAGEAVTFTLFRDGKERVVNVKLGKRLMPPLPEDPGPGSVTEER